MRARQLKYYQKHKSKILAKQKKTRASLVEKKRIKIYMRKWRENNLIQRRVYKQTQVIQNSAHQAVKYALKTGKLIKTPCVKCGATEVQGHHKDYSKKLDVIWLCRHCHAAEHN